MSNNSIMMLSRRSEDPLSQYVRFLLSNGGYIADGTGICSVTPVNSVVLTTANKMYGNDSVRFDGNPGQVQITSPDTFQLNANVDFTIELWIYLRAYGATAVGPNLFGTDNTALGGYSFNVGTDMNSMRLISASSGRWTDDLVVNAGGGVPLNTWTHVALERFGDLLTIYKNGQNVGSRTGFATRVLGDPSNFGLFGYFNDSFGNARSMNGDVDDHRVTIGVARYKGEFTPPLELVFP